MLVSFAMAAATGAATVDSPSAEPNAGLSEFGGSSSGAEALVVDASGGSTTAAADEVETTGSEGEAAETAGAAVAVAGDTSEGVVDDGLADAARRADGGSICMLLLKPKTFPSRMVLHSPLHAPLRMNRCLTFSSPLSGVKL